MPRDTDWRRPGTSALERVTRRTWRVTRRPQIAEYGIGTRIAATDTDTSDTLEYTLSGTDAAKFEVITTNGQIQTKAGEKYSYETDTSYSVTVTVEDGNGRSDSIDVTLDVTDQDEPPLRPEAPTVRGPANSSTSSLRVTMTPAEYNSP